MTVRALRAGASTPVLTDAHAAAVAALARKAERHFGRPQDIEWALEQGRVLLLQSRPITTLAGLADPDGGRRIWDNSNIAESYSGVTTPLTFSFARTVYEEVYRQFCGILAVPRARVEDHRVTFETMLGLVRGRVYYNLLSWYRVLALLPGFSVNRRFMEQMMGVREALPDEVLAGAPAATGWDRFVDALRLGRSLVGLVWALVRLPRSITRFYARLDAGARRADAAGRHAARRARRALPHARAPAAHPLGRAARQRLLRDDLLRRAARAVDASGAAMPPARCRTTCSCGEGGDRERRAGAAAAGPGADRRRGSRTASRCWSIGRWPRSARRW